MDEALQTRLRKRERSLPGYKCLGAVELVSGLDGSFRPGDFRCEGPVAGDDTYTWVCSDPSESYGLEVIGDDPLAVLSATATTRGVTDEDAKRFFSYVLALSVGKAGDALDAETWVAGALLSGGTTFAGDTEISVYGSEEARALQVTASGPFGD